MAFQSTPPPGWPHTEAGRHYTDPAHEANPVEVEAPGKKRSGTPGCVVLLIVLALVGVIAAVAATWVSGGGDALVESAEAAFLAENPGWEVETADMPAGSDGYVRLVTWDPGRAIGRVAYVLQLGDAAGGWQVEPLVMGASRADMEDTLLDAFSRWYSDTYYSYAVETSFEAEDGEYESWRLTWRLWDDATGEWQESSVERVYYDTAAGVWYSESEAAQARAPGAEEVTATP